MTPDPQTLELRAAALRLALRPDLGGAIAGFWHGDTPVLRSVEGAAMTHPRQAGSFPLVPYSNRIADCRFVWDGQPRGTRPNFGPSPHSLHGVGFLRPWSVGERSETSVVLHLRHAPDADWPFAFDATQQVRLDAEGLSLEMTVTNRADTPAPVGLGWHPHFPKRQRSRLHAELSGRWEADETLLPSRLVKQNGIDADMAHLDFDNCFVGWQGSAAIRDEKVSLLLTSSLPYLVVYTPPQFDFFAVEPVSHANNAINMADPAAHGLITLAPGASTSGWMRLQIREAR
ncbi:aldose 1-epimerase [Aquabacterium sp. A7-Y]|uniref:aldose 1-epimerase n=1 Tax=Aquabacterium sp. A7-Y TaxID=1349605 RepID=UPI00223D8A7D|nr:aldose 1-epimerase [Aquabacterium sp. A7-Y]MCW7539554.1 aldose 1-epimerase [Aquabacterium sp. A7-Y]